MCKVWPEGRKWSELACVIQKSDIVEHYGNLITSMQLGMFREQVYQRGPGGMSEAGMLKVQMMAENGGEGIREKSRL